MRKLLSGLAVATVLSLPATAVVATAPAQASESRATASATQAAPTATDARKATRTISVKDTPGPKARLRIFVRPEYGNKPIIIQTRKAGKFVTTGRVRTNGKGVAIKTFAGSRKGIRYRLIAKGGRDYETAGFAFTITTRYF